MKTRKLTAAILFLVVVFPLFSDTTSSTTSTASSTSTSASSTATNSGTDTAPVPVPYDPNEFSTWQKDLRRAEIISFGSLPFVTFMASIYYDVYRYYEHGQQSAYRPWPFKDNDTAIATSEDSQKSIILMSVGISLGVALFDYGFRAIRREIRNKKAEKEHQLAPEPIKIEPVIESSSMNDSITADVSSGTVN